MASLALALATTLLLVGRTDARTGPEEARSTVAVPKGRTVEGRAHVADGDTLVVAGVRIRLEGIDAPEVAQSCETRGGEPWPCGRIATRALERLIGGAVVRCVSEGVDRYGRTLGICEAGGREINREMVRQGLAWAFQRYSQRYMAVEAEARARGLGIWNGANTPAWDYRAGHWKSAEGGAPEGCAIKGNVTANGLIYHMPWSPWYAKVKMEPGKGKRWFCSEAEAIAAGWRPALMQ